MSRSRLLSSILRAGCLRTCELSVHHLTRLPNEAVARTLLHSRHHSHHATQFKHCSSPSLLHPNSPSPLRAHCLHIAISTSLCFALSRIRIQLFASKFIMINHQSRSDLKSNSLLCMMHEKRLSSSKSARRSKETNPRTSLTAMGGLGELREVEAESRQRARRRLEWIDRR